MTRKDLIDMSFKKPAVLVASAFAAMAMLPACSSDAVKEDNPFCDLAEEFDWMRGTSPQELAYQFGRLVALAPDSLKDDLTFMAETYDLLIHLDQTDQEAMQDAAAKMDPDRFARLTTELPDRLQEACH